jgi:hypothetical protein
MECSSTLSHGYRVIQSLGIVRGITVRPLGKARPETLGLMLQQAAHSGGKNFKKRCGVLA